MSEESAFLASIRAEPADDLRRLVYADWLEEHGRTELAEFIRVQIELAKVTPEPKQRPMCRLIGVASKRGESAAHLRKCKWCKWTMSWGERLPKLQQREQSLWLAVGDEVVKSMPKDWPATVPSLEVAAVSFLGRLPAIVSRGFVSEVRCRYHEWCELCSGCGGYGNVHASGECVSEFTGIGPQVVANNPVTRVVLTDREPYGSSSEKEWWWIHSRAGDDRHTLPDAIWRSHLISKPHGPTVRSAILFPTAKAALDALSAVLILWAKSQPVPT